MTKKIKEKKSFGTLNVDHFSPALPADMPIATNVTISFEEALKLSLGLGQLLGRLNSYNRATTKGKKSAVNICLWPGSKRITINEGSIM
ncbi:MAG: hypothetical protein Q7U76_03925 [Nitrospirota bacterium]|nr:hypothetical protein [Nitrospirota bacterium]